MSAPRAGKVVPLVSYEAESKTWVVGSEAKSFLQEIREPMGVIAVAGPYRIGKSTYLNQLARCPAGSGRVDRL